MEKVRPIKNLKTRYTSFNCGACGKLIARNGEKCKRCGTPADWYRIDEDEVGKNELGG